MRDVNWITQFSHGVPIQLESALTETQFLEAEADIRQIRASSERRSRRRTV
jgi:hypothetical protein